MLQALLASAVLSGSTVIDRRVDRLDPPSTSPRGLLATARFSCHSVAEEVKPTISSPGNRLGVAVHGDAALDAEYGERGKGEQQRRGRVR